MGLELGSPRPSMTAVTHSQHCGAEERDGGSDVTNLCTII